MKTFSKNRKYWLLMIVSMAGMGWLLTATHPQEVSLAFLFLPIMLIFLLVFAVCGLILNHFNYLSGQRRFFGSFIVATTTSLIIILSSVGSMSWADLVAIAAILFIAFIYLTRAIF